MLEESKTALVEAYDLVMFDLDGVVYVGGEAIRCPRPSTGSRESGSRGRLHHQQWCASRSRRSSRSISGTWVWWRSRVMW